MGDLFLGRDFFDTFEHGRMENPLLNTERVIVMFFLVLLDFINFFQRLLVKEISFLPTSKFLSPVGKTNLEIFANFNVSYYGWSLL